MNPALAAYGSRLRSTLPGDADELRARHEAVVAAGAELVPDWLALVSRLTLAGLDALAVCGDPALALSEHAERAAEQADPEDVERALAQLGAIASLPELTATLWQRFADFTAPLVGVDIDSDLAVMDLGWSIEAMSDAELEVVLADCNLLVAAPDVRGDVRQLAALVAGVAETQIAGAVDEGFLAAACLCATDVRARTERRDAENSDHRRER